MPKEPTILTLQSPIRIHTDVRTTTFWTNFVHDSNLSLIISCGRNTWRVMPSKAGRFRNKTYTTSLPLTNGQRLARSLRSAKRRSAYSPSVHLHSPMVTCVVRLFYLQIPCFYRSKCISVQIMFCKNNVFGT